jgi:hypothetical protein
MIFNTDYASATIYTNPKSELHEELVSFSKEYNIKTVMILDELKVNDPKNFGKGYGKELFINLLKNFDSIVACPSFVYYEGSDKAYSGRNAMDMETIESAPIKLLNSFYVRVATEYKFKCFTKISEGGQPFILMVKNA